MAVPTYPATNNQEAVDLNILNANTFHVVVNGSITDEADTYEGNGKIPSILKAINTMATYKAPIAWVEGGTENDILQPRLFGDFIFVPTGVPAPMGSIPTDADWKLYFQSVDSSLTDTGQNYYREEVVSTKNTFSVDFEMQQFTVDGIDKPQITVFIHKDGVSRKVDVDDLNWISINSFSISYSVLAGSVVEVLSETIASFTLISAIRDEAQGYADAAQISATAAAASATEADGYADAAAASATSAASSASSAASAATDAVNAALSGVEADITALETSVATNTASIAQKLGINNLLWIRDEKTSGTAGGSTSAGTWHTRDLNTVKLNNITGASLASNRVTLPAGTYYVRATAPCDAVGSTRLKIYNYTDSADTLVGPNCFSNSNYGAALPGSVIEGTFTLAAQKTVEFRMYAAVAVATNGLGRPQSIGTEVYTETFIWKVS